MKFLFYLQQLSIRTKFILFTILVFVITNIFVSVFYPITVYDSELQRLTRHFDDELARIANQDIVQDKHLNYDEAFISNLFSQLELQRDLEALIQNEFS